MYENYRVLFVDDEMNILSAIKRGLIDEEYTCHFATSGADALKIMEDKKIAVIVSDMRMPGMDGLRLLKQVKEKWPKTVRIVLSGYTQLQQILTTINQADIFKFITKPWKLEEEFTLIIHQALDFYKLVEENEESKKALENKNIAYQNILKNIETTISKAKSRAILTGLSGKIFIAYNRTHLKELNLEILAYEEKIYDFLIAGFIGDEKECSLENAEEDISRQVGGLCKINRVERDYNASGRIRFVPALLEAIISSCCTVFQDEFSQYGLNVRYNAIRNKSFVISLISSNVDAMFGAAVTAGVDIFDKKVELVNVVLGKSVGHSGLGFRATMTGGHIVIFIKIILSI